MRCELFVNGNLLFTAGIYEVQRSLHFQSKHKITQVVYTKSTIFSYFTSSLCMRIPLCCFVSVESRQTRHSVQFKLFCCTLTHIRDWTFSFLVYSYVVYLTILSEAQNVTLSDNIMNLKGRGRKFFFSPINELCNHLPGKLSKT